MILVIRDHDRVACWYAVNLSERPAGTLLAKTSEKILVKLTAQAAVE